MHRRELRTGPLAAAILAVDVTTASAADDKDALIKDALSAAPPDIAKQRWSWIGTIQC